MLPIVLLLTGAALAVAGLALMSVPVALVVAGVGLVAFALLFDPDRGERS